jgi:peptidoglycan/xylan/chitin deacetylase (PgdA/CDA1 family)
MSTRTSVKMALGRLGSLGPRRPIKGATLLIHHRVGGGTADELDLPRQSLQQQLDLLVDDGHDVLSLDAALDRLDSGDPSPSVVLTFDDGFHDLYEQAWPLLRERGLPFIVYLTAGLVGQELRWEGSVAASQGAPAVTWDELGEMHASGLCTVGNHTWDHAGPDTVDEDQLDRCSDLIEAHIGVRPRHFAWTWGIEVPELRPAIAARFRSAATGELGRNEPGGDTLALRRVPVRATDPLAFYRAKLQGRLLPERAYAALVSGAKRLTARGHRG